jgi:hypothetical protein
MRTPKVRPKTRILSIRVDEAFKREMEGAAEDRGISLSGYLRQLAKLDLRSRESASA